MENNIAVSETEFAGNEERKVGRQKDLCKCDGHPNAKISYAAATAAA